MKERLFRMGERVIHKKSRWAGKVIRIKLLRNVAGETYRHLVVYYPDHRKAGICVPEALELDVLGELAR